jgi:TatD DNase family protein
VIDTHCHLGLCELPAAELVADAGRVGVRRMLSVGIDEAGSEEAIATAEQHSEVYACVGRHPNGTTGFDDAAAGRIEELAADPRVAAVDRARHYRDRAPAPITARAGRTRDRASGRKALVIHVRGGQTTDARRWRDVRDQVPRRPE